MAFASIGEYSEEIAETLNQEKKNVDANLERTHTQTNTNIPKNCVRKNVKKDWMGNTQLNAQTDKHQFSHK